MMDIRAQPCLCSKQLHALMWRYCSWYWPHHAHVCFEHRSSWDSHCYWRVLSHATYTSLLEHTMSM